MPSFDYTVELERDLLKLVTSSPMLCRMYIHQFKDEWFSSPERKFILAIALDIFQKTKSTLTRKVFEYEVGSRVADNDIVYYVGEWNIIEAVETQESPEVLIAKLKEAGMGRRILELGHDLTTLLEGGQIIDAVSHLKRTAVSFNAVSEDKPIIELTDFEKRKNVILEKRAHPEKYLGIKTGFKTFDDKTGGLFRGELTLIAGLTGVGKSTLVKQIERNIVMLNAGRNVLHIANEEYQEQVEHKFDAGFTDIPYLDFKLARISDEDLERWERLMRGWKFGRVFMKEVPAFTDMTLAEQAFHELESKGIPIHAIVVDHLPHIKPIQQAWGENDELKKAAADCKELARAVRVPVVVPTQAATIVADKQEKGRRAGQLDVYGSKGQVHVANTFMIVTEQGKDDTQTNIDESERDVFWLCDVKKARDGARFAFRAKHYVKVGRVEEVASGTTPQQALAANHTEVLNEVTGDGEPVEEGAPPAAEERPAKPSLLDRWRTAKT